MSLTTDPNHPDLGRGVDAGPVPQNKVYLVLSEEERAKGFVRPVRCSYRHVGRQPKYPLRDLTAEEHESYDRFGYVKFEAYPFVAPETQEGVCVGRFWTEVDLASAKKACGTVTTMAREFGETYATRPSFYSSTFCCACSRHLPVEEFVWVEADGTDGPVVGT